ncbi:hypothetical protein ACROYT_G034401 [Oculina patagonica]
MVNSDYNTMKGLIFTVAVALGCLQCAAELPAVGKCSFMEYYCTLREYESHFFKKLYEDPTADCGLQFWIFYYRSLLKAGSCFSKTLEVANMKEIQSLYCSGLDLEVPLMFSLPPCSNTYRNKVHECINDFATTFTSTNNDNNNNNNNKNTRSRRSSNNTNVSLPKPRSTLCGKRAKAKMCTVLAWQTNCNQSDMADGIFNKIIAISNPFCKNDIDPWAVEADTCANYSLPYRNPECGSCPAELRTHTCPRKSAAGIGRGVVHHLLSIFFFTAAILQL